VNKVLITGANRGIGLELCRQLQARGDSVIAVCRNSSEALEQLDLQVIDGVDVNDLESINRLREKLGSMKIDWLMNNAGILSVESLHGPDYDAMARQFSINTLGPLKVTTAMLAHLAAGAKVGIVTSRMGSIEDNTSGGYYGYRASKAAVNMVGKSLAIDLAERGIAVALLHPGMVATDMTGHRGVAVEHAANGLIQRMDELGIQTTGRFWHAEGGQLPW
jgi:NAD(P)-dependent dehydrogenase (short-subunit alcohol dehydrogenase family)